MKIIDLLNKIANGEDFKEKHIKYFDRIDQEYDICMICEANIIYKLDEISIKLNDEIEIIEDTKEDKKIEKLEEVGKSYACTLENANVILEIKKKINEIIDVVNEMRGKLE